MLEKKSPPFSVLELEGESHLAGTVLQLLLSESGGHILRTENGRRTDLYKILKDFAIDYSFVGPYTMLLFLGSLQVVVEENPNITNENTGYSYTKITVLNESNDQLFVLSYDPYYGETSSSNAFSISEIRQAPTNSTQENGGLLNTDYHADEFGP